VPFAAYGVDDLPWFFLRYTTVKDPGMPTGYEVRNVRKIEVGYDRAEMAAFIAAVENCTMPPLPSKQELHEIATKLWVSPAEIALIWMGGLNVDNRKSNFLPAQWRATLGLKAAEAVAGRQALNNLNGAVRERLYAAVVSQGCAAPFAADRRPVLNSVEMAWRALMPKRLPLDATLQTRLAAIGRMWRWQYVEHESLLAIAADPTKELQPRDVEIKATSDEGFLSLRLGAKGKNEQAIAGQLLRSIVHLVALVHSESAVGHPVRCHMPNLIRQTTRLVDHPGTTLELCRVHIYTSPGGKQLKLTEWLNKHLGITKVNSCDATARFDDDLITAATIDGD
jgi:hypothetical protein